MTDRDYQECSAHCWKLAAWLWNKSNRRVRINLDIDDLHNVGLMACYKAYESFERDHERCPALWPFAKFAAKWAMEAMIRDALAQEFRGLGVRANLVQVRSQEAFAYVKPYESREFDLVDARNDAAVMIASVPRHDRSIVRGLYYSGLMLREVGKQRGKSWSWVQWKRDAILAALREKFKGDCDE